LVLSIGEYVFYVALNHTINRLQSVAQGATSTRGFTYDAAGNITQDVRIDGVYAYHYNAANRMDRVTKDGVVLAEYKYNAKGQQVWRQLNGQGITIQAVFDLDGNRVAEYNAENGQLLAEYVWLNGAPLAVISNGVTYYVRSDHIGKPVFATDGTGAKVWSATYKPFGEVDTSTGLPINLRYPGQWFSAESGLYQNWMRDYDPTTGRYVQADPLGLVDGASVYGYALHSPDRYVDPKGERCRWVRRSDGNQELKCSPGSTYSPSGQSSFYDPIMNDREYKQCMKECKPGHGKKRYLTCTGVGSAFGYVTGTGMLGSIPSGTVCRWITKRAQCDLMCRDTKEPDVCMKEEL